MGNKHTIKYFFCDNGGVLNLDGTITDAYASDESIADAIGADVMAECNNMAEREGGSYGCIIEYTIKPITKDPYK